MITDDSRATEPSMAERLRATATVAYGDAVVKAQADLKEGADKRERHIQEAARLFYVSRVAVLPELLANAAAKGRFEWQVWKEEVGMLNASSAEYHLRGLRMVAAWLVEQGFVADLKDTGVQDIPDYGRTRTVTLTARWSA